MKIIRKSCSILLFLVIVIANVFSYSIAASALRNAKVVFSPTTVENSFPKSIKFSTHVVSEETVQSAKFLYYVLNDTSVTQVPVVTQSSKEMDLTYTWDTSNTGAVPGTPILYHWEATLSSGEVVRSDEEQTSYDDIRFDWQVREKEKIAVWWHDRPASLGEQVFTIALQAKEKQKELFGVDLDYPIKVIIYNTPEEFAEWHSTSTTYMGGQAFPSLGITTEIVEDTIWQDEWLMDVVPHEISHLYFFQVTYHPLSDAPSWLDEGVAQFNEFGDHSEILAGIKDTIREGTYLPLWGLTGGFNDSDEDQFQRSYDESLGAVTYLIDAYGKDGLSRLLASYKKGKNTKEAFPLALGRTFEEFEQDWLIWLGAPEGTYVKPPQIEPPSASDYFTQVVLGATATKLARSVTQTPQPTSTSTPIPTVTATRTATTSTTSQRIVFAGFGLCLLGLCAIATALTVGALLFWKRKTQ